MSTSCSSDSEFEDWMDDTVEVDDSLTLLRLWMSAIWSDNSSRRRRRYLCSLCRFSRAVKLLRSRSSKFLMKCLALLSRPRVVCRELSLPTGTISFRFSRQLLRCARLFFSSSLCVDLFPCGFLVFLFSLVEFLVVVSRWGSSSPGLGSVVA